MTAGNNQIISLKKLKKGGAIDRELQGSIINILKSGGLAAMPVDHIYGIISMDESGVRQRLEKICGGDESGILQMISTFRMLEDIALIDKMKFDFLHRIWPGEVIVKLNRRDPLQHSATTMVLLPKNRYMKDIIDSMGSPLIFIKGYDNGRFFKLKDKKLVSLYQENIEITVIIDELCREHPFPTIVDLTGKDLEIIHEGKVSSDEIKSLYFLDKM